MGTHAVGPRSWQRREKPEWGRVHLLWQPRLDRQTCSLEDSDVNEGNRPLTLLLEIKSWVRATLDTRSPVRGKGLGRSPAQIHAPGLETRKRPKTSTPFVPSLDCPLPPWLLGFPLGGNLSSKDPKRRFHTCPVGKPLCKVARGRRLRRQPPRWAVPAGHRVPHPPPPMAADGQLWGNVLY